MSYRSAAPLLLVLVAGKAGCAGGEAGECVVGADCASGVCDDGLCVAGADGGDGDAGGAQPDAAGGACSANLDGVIARDEVPIAPGLTASFRVATDAPVDTAGASRPDGTRQWDLSNALPGDRDVGVTLAPLDGEWFADAFPGASYSTPLSDAGDVIGVFEITQGSLLLRGVVSPQGGATRTELAYDPPIAVFRFPLAMGTAWDTTSTVTGVTSGVASLFTESYEQTVDAEGELATPFGTFDVLRTRVELTRTVGVAVTTSRQYLFSSECFGTVASIASNDYEAQVEFDTAREVRRLAP